MQKRVSDYMISPIAEVGIDTPLEEAHQMMRERSISCLLVVGRDGPAGVISRTDILQVAHVRRRIVGSRATLELPAMCVGDVMTSNVYAVAANAELTEAAAMMKEKHIHRVFVRNEAGQLAGVFSTKDAMRVVVERRMEAPISQHMSSPVATCETSETLGEAVGRLAKAGLSGVAVLEGGRAIGMFTQEEALEARELPASTLVEEAMTQSLVCLPIDTPLFRAAGIAIATRARRVLATEHHHLKGILTGLDFATALGG